MKMHHPNPEDLLNFDLTITPDEGQSSLSVLLFSRWEEQDAARAVEDRGRR